MRERWLLQGTGAEEEEVRRKQLEEDEEQGKRLEDMIHGYTHTLLMLSVVLVSELLLV